jgi:hypothetical protein
LKVQKKETTKHTDDRTVTESGVMLCRHCDEVLCVPAVPECTRGGLC